jgi:hypothetical protein
MFATDRGTLVVQGYRVTDAHGLADVGDVPDGETLVEIPPELLRFADDPMDRDPRPGHGEDGRASS